MDLLKQSEVNHTQTNTNHELFDPFDKTLLKLDKMYNFTNYFPKNNCSVIIYKHQLKNPKLYNCTNPKPLMPIMTRRGQSRFTKIRQGKMEKTIKLITDN